MSSSLLLFNIGPVQSFIESAQSIRDLWAGSFLLADLTRAGIKVLQSRGMLDRIVSPRIDEAILQRSPLKSPCLPNRFLAEVDVTDRQELVDSIKTGTIDRWKEIATAVREGITAKIEKEMPEWSAEWSDACRRFWDAQCDRFFVIRTLVVPKTEEGYRRIEELAPHDTKNTGSNDDSAWTKWADYAATLMNSAKMVRTGAGYAPEAISTGYPGKCSLLGTYEQIGPANLSDASRYWEQFAARINIHGTHVRPGERLSAVSLVKRFAWPLVLSREARLSATALRFDDTATAAASLWLKSGIELDPATIRDDKNIRQWNGQWLHWSAPLQSADEPKCPDEVWERIKHKSHAQGKPPTYYAILQLDGDFMGERLRDRAGREHQESVSQVLSRFASERIEDVVERATSNGDGTGGMLIYCGGDDVLAILPVATILQTALDIRESFIDHWKSSIAYGKQPSVSAGIAIVHIKEDLRFALAEARAAEKKAKNIRDSKNAVAIRVCRRSGEHSEACLTWKFLPYVNSWASAYAKSTLGKQVSDRWSYRVYGDIDALVGLPTEAAKAELSRQLKRSDEATRAAIESRGSIEEQFQQYIEDTKEFRFSRFEPNNGEHTGEALRHFMTLCQTASFIARGRDE